MSEFINTADVIGDDEMCDQIIQRTVTEYKENRITTVGQYAFYGCNALTEVDVPNVTTLKGYAFGSCSALTTVNIPKVSSVARNIFTSSRISNPVSFDSLSSLTDGHCFYINYCPRFTFPVLTAAPGYAFYDTKVPVLDFHAITNIANYAFQSSSVSTLIIRTPSVCTTGTISLSSSVYIYVPSSLVDSYKAATNWSAYADQFRALEDYTVDGTTTGELDESKI